jgi:hypothetical protein
LPYISLRIDKFFVLSPNDRHPAAVIWGCKVRRGARRALGVGAALITIVAVSSARADVVAIDLNPCSESCIVTGVDDAAADEDDPAGDDAVSMSRSGGAEGADASPNLLFDPKALPPILAEGLPSPIASIGAQTPESPSISPYAFFKEVVDIPLPMDPRTGLAAASINLFAPSLIGRLTLTDVLSNSNDLFQVPPLHPEM